MTTTQFDIVDVHMHAWPAEGDEALLAPGGPATLDEKVFADTLAQMDTLGISYGVISGPNNVTLEWCRRAPNRFIASWMPAAHPADPGEEANRFADGIATSGFAALGECIMCYAGLAINDQRFFPLYRICQERRLPVCIHTGLNGPDPASNGVPAFRVNLCNPLLLEDVVAAFPDLKIVMCHMSYPFTEQATYMLHTHSNIYMDVGVVDWYLGRAGFHRLLKQVVDVVGVDKILFGSDQMNAPQMIPVAVSAITEAGFLGLEDKRKILGDNARKLLRIAELAQSGFVK